MIPYGSTWRKSTLFLFPGVRIKPLCHLPGHRLTLFARMRAKGKLIRRSPGFGQGGFKKTLTRWAAITERRFPIGLERSQVVAFAGYKTGAPPS